MTRPVISVAAVSYLNTIPFLYGLRHSGELTADFLLSPPGGCTEAFDSRKADIALVPVGGLPLVKDPDFDIVTSWCIGADGPVRTVVMVSDVPLKAVKRVWLDSHSHTSVALARTLAAKYWKISPEWIDLNWFEEELFVKNAQMQGSRSDAQGSVPDVHDRANHEYNVSSTECRPSPQVVEASREGDNAADARFSRKDDAFVLIGDKVFDHEGRFAHSVDLAEEWRRHTGLPFVFAVWVARKSVPNETIAALESALSLGVERTYESILDSEYADRPYAYEYLTRNIDYIFDERKRRALQLFWDEGLKATLRANPG